MLPYFYSRSFRPSADGFALGDHILSIRAAEVHHGIYIGSCQVIGLFSNRILQQSLDAFSINEPVFVLPAKSDYSASEIVRRAKSQLGMTINHPDSGELFCKWCRHGLLAIP